MADDSPALLDGCSPVLLGAELFPEFLAAALRGCYRPLDDYFPVALDDSPALPSDCFRVLPAAEPFLEFLAAALRGCYRLPDDYFPVVLDGFPALLDDCFRVRPAAGLQLLADSREHSAVPGVKGQRCWLATEDLRLRERRAPTVSPRLRVRRELSSPAAVPRCAASLARRRGDSSSSADESLPLVG